MNTIHILITVAMFAGAWQPAECAENEDLTHTVEVYSKEIKGIIDPERWVVEADATTIVISSKFTIEIQTRVSPAIGQKPESKVYRIELSFKPHLSKDAYIKLAKERVEYAAIINYGAKTKMKWANASNFLKNNPLPRYDVNDRVGKSHSVYVSTTDSTSISIGPAKEYAEVKSVEALVDKILEPNAH